MATDTSAAVKITKDGMIPVPQKLQQVLGLEPAQIVQLCTQDDRLIVQRLSPSEIGDQIVALLKQALAGTTWDDIKVLRTQDEDWR
jgi:bifunctional DNA-binding transcriptional regulator/antitoxin component of YhaV-PrlF toxin-antitoxin module